MNDKPIAARGLDARCHRRAFVRSLGVVAATVAVAGGHFDAAGANPAPRSGEPIEGRLPSDAIDVSHDTQRAAGLGLAAAAILVAAKLIRDKERDPEL